MTSTGKVGIALRFVQWVLGIFVFGLGLFSYVSVWVNGLTPYLQPFDHCFSREQAFVGSAFALFFLLLGCWILRDTKVRRLLADIVFAALCVGWLQIGFGLYLYRAEFLYRRQPHDYYGCMHSPYWITCGCVLVAGSALVHFALRRKTDAE